MLVALWSETGRKPADHRTVATKLRTAPVGERISVSPLPDRAVPITGFPPADRDRSEMY